MSYSISNLFQQLDVQSNKPLPEDKLYNPDLPLGANRDQNIRNFKDIKTKAYSALKLGSEPRNGNYFRLPRNPTFSDPRQENFMADGAIDPNVIRKLQNPISAIPSRMGGYNALYGVGPNEFIKHDSMNLVKQARQSYVNYKDRFELPVPQGRPGRDPNPNTVAHYAIPTTEGQSL